MTGKDYSVTLRTCCRCGEEKPIDKFRATGASLRRQCKRCDEDSRPKSSETLAHRAAMQKARRARATPEAKAKAAADCKAYSVAHAEELKAYKKVYREANAGKIAGYMAARYADPVKRDEARQRAVNWRIANPARKARTNEAWAKANPTRMAEYSRESKRRRRENPSHRLYASIGTQLRLALAAGKRGRKWESLVGYTRDELARHLERQFVGWMSWANYGLAWHIDHIVPQLAFELDTVDLEAVRACWALSNLRPLPSSENVSKGARRTHLI